MKDIVISTMLIAVGVLGLSNSDGIRQLYSGAFPLSAEKQQALDRCAAANSAFDRFDAGDRDGCYARLHVAPPSIQTLGPPSVPKDDIRRVQATQR